MKAPSAPTLPKCRDCGGGQPRVVGTERDGFAWLCASCEYLWKNPGTTPTRPLPLPRERRPKALQKERLFGD